MGHYVARRLLQFIPTLLIVAVLIFFLIDLVPGDPVVLLLGIEDASGESVAAMRHQLGLDLPLYERMARWFSNALRGDLGTSLFQRKTMAEILASSYPVTISLALLSSFVAVIVGVSAGIIAAVNQGGVRDWTAMTLALAVLSVPSFWLGINLIFFFGVKLRWFPVGGFVPLSEDPVEYLHHMALPALTMGLGGAALIARMTRTSMLEVLRMDYVRTARAKGLRHRIVILRHAFRNALIPVVTVVGISFGAALGGSAVIEAVYNMHGVGTIIVNSILRRDYPVIQGSILVLTLTYLVANLAVDLLYAWLDPRIRYE